MSNTTDERGPRALLHPEVVVAAALTALVSPLGPGAILALRAALLPANGFEGIARARATTLALLPNESLVLGLGALALVAFLPRLVLTIATVQASRGKTIQPVKALVASSGRVLRARGVSMMVATFTFWAAAGILVNVARSSDSDLVATLCALLAAFVATAGFGMASLTDRAAIFDVSGAQDARAAQLRREGRFAGPHYLDTTTARAGYDIATSADDATTVGMKAFLGGAAWAAALATLAVDAVPTVIAVFVFDLAGASAVWLSPFGFADLGVIHWIFTIIVFALRAVFEIGLARLWTRVYESNRRAGARGADAG